MKRSSTLLAALTLVSLIPVNSAVAADKAVTPTQKSEIAITYTVFEGNPVQLVVDQNTDTVRLQVQFANQASMNTAKQNGVGTFLEQESKRFGTGTAPVPIAETGLSFKLDGRYQLSRAEIAPSTATRSGYLYTLLGKQPRIVQGVIQARGAMTQTATAQQP